MSDLDLHSIAFESEGTIHHAEIKQKVIAKIKDDSLKKDNPIDANNSNELEQCRNLIRTYAMNALDAFKDFSPAEITEITLRFGVKIGGKAGIPYITEGSAESNLEIEVKCKLPN